MYQHGGNQDRVMIWIIFCHSYLTLQQNQSNLPFFVKSLLCEELIWISLVIWQIKFTSCSRWQTFVWFAIVVVACILEHTCNVNDFYPHILACFFAGKGCVDYVRIWDLYHPLEEFCGISSRFSLKSKSNVASVMFHSDGANQYNGFELVFTANSE